MKIPPYPANIPSPVSSLHLPIQPTPCIPQIHPLEAEGNINMSGGDHQHPNPNDRGLKEMTLD